MSYDKEVRATVALLGGSMATVVAGPLTTVAPLKVPGQTEDQVKMRKASRSKTFARKDEKRNSALGFLSLFGRKNSEKTRSAIFQLPDDSLDEENRKSITASNPYLASIGLPYPLRPQVSKSSSSSSLLSSPSTPYVIFYALGLSWAEEVHETTEMSDQIAPNHYDDDDVDYDNCFDITTDYSMPSSPDLSSRKYSLLFRRQGIRRKDTGSGKSMGKNGRRFTHAGVTSGNSSPDPNVLAVSYHPLGAVNKVLRGISAPVTSSGAETSSDSDDDDNNSAIVFNDLNAKKDVVDQHQPGLENSITIPASPCLIHHNMSQYINNITFFFFVVFLKIYFQSLSKNGRKLVLASC